MTWEVKVGDSKAVLAGMDPESVSAVVTDPPYGLSKEPDIEEVLSKWKGGGSHQHTQPTLGSWERVGIASFPILISGRRSTGS